MSEPEAAALLASWTRGPIARLARAELAIAKAHATDVDPDDLAMAYAAMGQRTVALSSLQTHSRRLRASGDRQGSAFSAIRDDPQVAHMQKPA